MALIDTTQMPRWATAQVDRLAALPVPGWLWIVVLWFLMTFPAIVLRSAHFEEGTVIALARGAVERGHWLEPDRYGARFVERPVMLSWIAALLATATGKVMLWQIRIPNSLALLAGGLLVYRLIQSQATKSAALFGAACWFACPMIALRFVTAEPDVLLSVLLFAAFYFWWLSESGRGTTLGRWSAIGLILAAAALTKGPQPVAFFTLGIGAYLILECRWSELPGFLIANAIAGVATAAWYGAVIRTSDFQMLAIHSRIDGDLTPTRWFTDHVRFTIDLLLKWLPATLFITPALLVLRRGAAGKREKLLRAAFLYATICSLALLIWPGLVHARYAMPSALGMAVFAGLMFAKIRDGWPRLVNASVLVAAALCSYVVVTNWLIMPLLPNSFQRSWIVAQTIKGFQATIPGPLYFRDEFIDYDVLAYLEGPVRRLRIEEFRQLPRPAIAVLTDADMEEIGRANPTLRLVPKAKIDAVMPNIVAIESK